MEMSFTTSTVDSPAYKRLICGRTDDVARILGEVVDGHSVALFGEHRIGKTSLLYLTRDIINQQIAAYQAELIDRSLDQAIDNLASKASTCIAIYLNLHDLLELTRAAFSKLLHDKIQQHPSIRAWVQPQTFSEDCSFSETFKTIDLILSDRNQRLVVLMDEIEVLLDIPDGKQIFRNLRGIIQSYSSVSFVLAGAEYWHKQIKEKTSPIVNNVKTFYLKSPSRFAIENYLIKLPLSALLQRSTVEVNRATQIVLEWSGCKPYYVQAACQVIVEFYQREPEFSAGWQAVVERELEESVRAVLNYFYDHDNRNAVSRQILVLLAHKPGLTVKEISANLGYSARKIWDLINDLEALDQVDKQGSEYALVGKLIENWGQKTKDIALINLWSQRLKLAGIGFFLLLIPSIYFYSNPPQKAWLCPFKAGNVTVKMPESLESSEQGTANFGVLNEGSDKISLLTLTLKSDDIAYQDEAASSSRLALKEIDPEETRYGRMRFAATNKHFGRSFRSEILIEIDRKSASQPCFVNIAARRVPVKKYWLLVYPLLLAVSGILAKENLFKLAASILPLLIRTQKQSKVP